MYLKIVYSVIEISMVFLRNSLLLSLETCAHYTRQGENYYFRRLSLIAFTTNKATLTCRLRPRLMPSKEQKKSKEKKRKAENVAGCGQKVMVLMVHGIFRLNGIFRFLFIQASATSSRTASKSALNAMSFILSRDQHHLHHV